MPVLIIALATVMALLVYAIQVQRGLAGLGEEVQRRWAEVDTLLLERHDELATLIELLEERLPRARESIERLARARSAVFTAQLSDDPVALATAESQLRLVLADLQRQLDAGFELPPDDPWYGVATRIRELDTAIAEQSERYNDAASLLNIRQGRWPHALIARLAGIGTRPLIEFRDRGGR